jgi:hypothetical protein
VAFAEPTDVETAYEGSLPASAETRVQYLLDTASARLRILLPDLEDRAADSDDVALLAKDIIVQVVLRRLDGTAQQVRSETQAAGPYSTTRTYTTDSTGTFSDEDLAILRGGDAFAGSVGTIKMGTLVDWHDQ